MALSDRPGVKPGWNNGMNGKISRSNKGGLAFGGATFGSAGPETLEDYASRYKSQAAEAGGKADSKKTTDQAAGDPETDRLNKMGSNRF